MKVVPISSPAGPVIQIAEYRARDSEAVLLVALETVRKEGADGLVLCLRPRGEPVRTWMTGEYYRDPEKAIGLLSRLWMRMARQPAG